jgi:hypothetical protein
MTNEQIESASWEFAAKQIDQPRGWIRTAFVAGAEESVFGEDFSI